MTLLDRPATSRDVAFWGTLVASVSANSPVSQVIFSVFVWIFLGLEIYDVYLRVKKRKQLRKELAEARERMVSNPWTKPKT